MKSLLLCVLFGAVVILSGCVDVPTEDGTDEEITQTSLTEIRVGDMPTDDFIHVNVTFSEIKLHSNETGWVTISTDPTTIDLLYLHRNNLTEQLGIEDIELGNYTKLWIVVDNATGILNATGEQIIFDVPSDTLKIQQLFDIREGNNTITVDIDLDSSILSVGQGKSYKILPVIGAIRVKYANGTQVHIRDRDRIKNMTKNRAPVIDLVANGSRGKPISVTVGENITFNASETVDIDGDILSYFWDLDDGTTSNVSVVIHQYAEKGSYWVTLTVSDGELEATEQVHVTVKQQGGQGQGGQ